MPDKLNFKESYLSAMQLAVIVAVSTCIRFLPFSSVLPFNFSPLTAIALFSGFYFLSKWHAFLVPLACIWISDMFVNYLYTQQFQPFYEGFYWQYATYTLIVLLGSAFAKPERISTVLGASLTASIVFFITTNFGTWLTYDMYPKNMGGLVMCYIAGVPFFKISLMSDLFFGGFLYVLVQVIYKNTMSPSLK